MLAVRGFVKYATRSRTEKWERPTPLSDDDYD